MSFEIENVTDETSLARLFERDPKSLARDWYGADVTPAVKYWLGKNSRELLVAAQYPGSSQLFPDLAANQFFEGLWERDVFEVFLRNAKTGAYQEWNLSPQGAWWSAAFPSYRNRDLHYTPNVSRVVASGEVTTSGWTASLIFPIAELYSGIASDELEISVCAILGSSPRKYLCLKSDPESEPDFHHPNGFQSLSSRIVRSSSQ